MSTAKQIYDDLIAKQQAGVITERELILLDNILIAMAREDFIIFCTIMRSTRGWKWKWFHHYIMKRLQAKLIPVTQYDRERQRLLLRVGDQHAKTTILMLFLCWILGKFPNMQLMYLTYDKERAKEITPEVVAILIDPLYKRIFPDFKLSDEMDDIERQAEKSTQKLTNLFITNAGSPKTGKQGRLVLGGLADVLGLSGDLILCDDLLSGITDALSEKIRATKWRTLGSGVFSRQQANTKLIVTGTWWHREDPIGMIQRVFIDGEENLEEGTALWELIEFNSQKDHRDYPYDPRAFGEYLWPEERLTAYLDQKQTSPMDWQIKHQNLPLDTDGLLFKVTSFRIYDRLPTELINMKVIISIDTNYKTSATSDNAGITIWGIWNQCAYLLEFCGDKKFKLPELMRELVRLTQKYATSYYATVVEVKSQGQPVLDMASEYGLSKMIGYDPQRQGSKWERAQRVVSIFDAGQIYVPNEKICSSINFFINQHLFFTGEDNKKDDLVDTSVQMLLCYDHLFRGAPIKGARVVSRNDIIQGNLKRLMNITRNHGHKIRRVL